MRDGSEAALLDTLDGMTESQLLRGETDGVALLTLNRPDNASSGTETWDSLQVTLKQAGTEVVEGPVEREGGSARELSIYTRDPDSKLLEFIVYG